MKKNIILSVALAAATTMGLVSCDKSSPKMDDKTPASAQKSGECAKIAYVEVDSIMTQYKFCKEYSKILETKGNNIQKTLATKISIGMTSNNITIPLVCLLKSKMKQFYERYRLMQLLHR